MSTRAIITVKTSGKTDEPYPPQHLYAHGDGYPSGVGVMVHNFVNISKSLGPGGRVQKRTRGTFAGSQYVEGRYHKYSPRGRAYSGMENILSEPDQFMVGLISYLTSKGFGHLYLTDRDPVKEEKDTDIAWHYVVTIPGWGSDTKPKLEVYEYNWEAKSFRKKSASIPELVEQELAERRRYAAQYEKEHKADKGKARKQSSPRSGVRGLRS